MVIDTEEGCARGCETSRDSLPGLGFALYNFPMPLSSSIEHLPEGIAVVRLSGGLTLGTSLKVADTQIQTAIASGVTRMVIDLSGVEYVDSAGLGMLMYAYGLLNEKQGTLRVCGVADRVMSLLKMTKTDSFLPIDTTCEESVAALSQ
jgi:anti-sigma B factor antagonist